MEIKLGTTNYWQLCNIYDICMLDVTQLNNDGIIYPYKVMPFFAAGCNIKTWEKKTKNGRGHQSHRV